MQVNKCSVGPKSGTDLLRGTFARMMKVDIFTTEQIICVALLY